VHTDVVIERLAAVQHGVVSRRQLLVAGVSARAIDGRIAAGRLHVVERGVYRVGLTPGRRARELAAVLACGPQAVLSDRSAAAHWGIAPPATADTPLEVSTPRAVYRRVRGVVIHRRTLNPDEVTTHEAVPITGPVRTILDFGATANATELERAVAAAERAGLLRVEEVLAAARSRRFLRGAAPVRALLDGRETPALTRSEAETRLLQLIRRGNLSRPQVNASLLGFEVDFFWRDEQLVVEVDGFAYHASPRAFERDRRRDATLTAAGLRVIRMTWSDIVQRPEATLVTLARALIRR
jgi:very-short-patch-repair endonuclease